MALPAEYTEDNLDLISLAPPHSEKEKPKSLNIAINLLDLSILEHYLANKILNNIRTDIHASRELQQTTLDFYFD